VTAGKIENLLPWLGGHPEPPFCDPKYATDFSFCATSVHHGDLIRKQNMSISKDLLISLFAMGS
jgi:hypothetical protein